jgi:stress-induced morphogen
MKVQSILRTSMTTTFVFALSCSLASRTIIPTARAFSSVSKPSSYSSSIIAKRAFFSTTSSVNMSSNTNNAGPRQILIEERLKDTFNPLHLDVQNTSHGQKSDESHFKVVVVSEQFEGTRLVGRHRAINKAVSESDGSLGFHSLEIGAAKTPDEWNINSVVKESPKCAGGDGRGMKNLKKKKTI